MLFSADLHLFVRGFEVNAGAYEGAWSVFWLRTAPGPMPLASLSGIHLAHGAVQDKARLFPFCKNNI